MNTTIATTLRTLRVQHNMSQEHLAERLHVSRQAISKWERGEALPDTENLILLAKLYGVSLDTLVGIDTTSQQASDASSADTQTDAADDAQRDRHARRLSLWYALPYPIVTTLIFFLLGFFVGVWHIAWIVFLTIPLYYNIINCILMRSFSAFAIPILITCVFMLVGLMWGLWHPMWLLYLLIPIYYPLARELDRRIHAAS